MHRSQKRNKDSQVSSVFFALSGPTCIKAASEMLMILTPGVNFINILRAAFTSADPKSARTQSSCQSFLRFWDLGV